MWNLFYVMKNLHLKKVYLTKMTNVRVRNYFEFGFLPSVHPCFIILTVTWHHDCIICLELYFTGMDVVPLYYINADLIRIFVLLAQAWFSWWLCVCVALVGASISGAFVTVAPSTWWRAFTKAAAAPHWLSELGLQVIKLHKMFTDMSCGKCNTAEADLHSFSLCPRMKRFWIKNFKTFSDVLKIHIKPEPVLIILGTSDFTLKLQQDEVKT